LPQDIAEIPYHKIKDLLMILDVKEEYKESSRSASQARSNAQQMAGKGGKMYREV